jgi:hypothetical protein
MYRLPIWPSRKVRRSAAIWVLRLASSTVRPGQTPTDQILLADDLACMLHQGNQNFQRAIAKAAWHASVDEESFPGTNAKRTKREPIFSRIGYRLD